MGLEMKNVNISHNQFGAIEFVDHADAHLRAEAAALLKDAGRAAMIEWSGVGAGWSVNYDVFDVKLNKNGKVTDSIFQQRICVFVKHGKYWNKQTTYEYLLISRLRGKNKASEHILDDKLKRTVKKLARAAKVAGEVVELIERALEKQHPKAA